MHAQLHHSVRQLPLLPAVNIAQDDIAYIRVPQRHMPVWPQAAPMHTIQPAQKIAKNQAQERFRCTRITDFCLATDMLKFGYHHSVIAEQTGLSPKQTKSLWDKCSREKLIQPSADNNPRTPTALKISNRNTKIHISLLMQAYRKIGGQGIMRAVDIPALNSAWNFYGETVRQSSLTNARHTLITINQAWGLARMLKNGKACFEYCPDCQCWFFTAIEQQTTLCCPFCRA